MSAHDKRKARRAREAVKLDQDSVAQIAALRGQLEARDLRIERLEDDAATATRSRDEARQKLSKASADVCGALGALDAARDELATANTTLAKLEADLELADEDIRGWRERAQQWEALGKQAQKLRNRLDAKAKAAREAPARRKAATLNGGNNR